ncbi:hypothetical protein [Pseudonocardia acidicola]|uniref:Uncharacterized protein n=1 Tax=Pseudonocardia acidicola TaxID=2724939 RepID=A0ABX1SKD2_9PSEU|nr:hypothetical protein [Pseudonocardia acidicola]NMI02025.1 hypothetical protein [Pseudonocardia acidicola]
MGFVHGHPRRVGWVVSHHRRPTTPDLDQLPLDVPDLDDPGRGGAPDPEAPGSGSGPEDAATTSASPR